MRRSPLPDRRARLCRHGFEGWRLTNRSGLGVFAPSQMRSLTGSQTCPRQARNLDAGGSLAKSPARPRCAERGDGRVASRYSRAEPKPFEPRFSVHTHQPRSRDFSQIPLRSWRIDPVHPSWARNQLIPGSDLGGASYPNRSPSDSCPSCPLPDSATTVPPDRVLGYHTACRQQPDPSCPEC